MDAVGDIGDGTSSSSSISGQRKFHILPGDAPVQFGDGIAAIRETQGQDRHAEGLAPGLLVAGQVHELVTRQAEFGPEVGEVFVHQPEREFVVPCRDRGMGGENIACRGLGDGLLEGLALWQPVRAPVPGSGKRRDLRSCARQPGHSPVPAGRAPRPCPAGFPGQCAGPGRSSTGAAVSLRSAGVFSSRSVSSRYSGTRPTRSSQILALT